MTCKMNPHVCRLQSSGIRVFSALAAEKAGCISLTMGEPDFPTPEIIKSAAKRALDQDMSHYPPNAGCGELRAAIADFERVHHGYQYSPEEVLMTNGSTEGLFVSLFSILEPGDEVIVPVPAFSLYESIITMCGGKTIKVNTEDNHFQIAREDLERAVSPRTKALILNSPGNPSGTIYTEDTLKMICQFLRDKPIFVICDDVYGQLAFDENYRSYAAFDNNRERLIIAQSFSKPYAMTGWRAGYLLADRSVMGRLERVHQYIVVSAVSFVQPACREALFCDTKGMRLEYQRRASYVFERLGSMGLTAERPQGAFYLFPSIEKYGMSSDAFCRRLIEETGLALTPGSCFDGEGHVRISCSYSMDILKEGMNRLECFVRRMEAERKKAQSCQR